ncbi:MAG: ribonuclease P protein subunit [Candidatus Bathyarchaeota archaeon]|nr:MAG: ribonuclease P protein subunit [Candidatus Bathyarchaeota archaeon]
MVTIRNKIHRHELIGLDTQVVRSLNPRLEGISGVVVDETKNTLIIHNNTEKKRIPKDIAIFSFSTLDGKKVEVNGRELRGRPVDRIKKWRRRS